MFFVGQKVVCVDVQIRNIHAKRGLAKMPVKGAIYTIREIFEWDHLPLVRLSEILNPLHPKEKIEFGYEPIRFRPVTDISDLTSIVREMAKIANEQATEMCAKFAEQFARSKAVAKLTGSEALLSFAAAIRSTNAKVWPTDPRDLT